MERLRILVASSSEQIAMANEVAALLSRPGAAGPVPTATLEAHPWTDTTFTFSSTYIESLERELDRADFAAVIMTAADVGRVRGERVNLPRDNVIFELGLFTGRLGRDRCFFFIDAGSKTRIASDLSGVKEVDFVTASGTDESHPRRLEHRCREVARQMLQVGGRYKPSGVARALHHDRWRVASELAGCWWSFRYWDRQRLGFVTLAADDTGPTLSVSGRAYAPEAPDRVAARWSSVTSALVRQDQKWTLYYVWDGMFPARPGKRFGGTSRYEFPDGVNRSSGNGYILEANLGDLAATKEKALELRRCTEAEADIMEMKGIRREKSEMLRHLLMSWRRSRR